MGLKLTELQKVVKTVVKEEKHFDVLKNEVVRVFGPTVLASRGLKKMAQSANERIDILEATDASYEQIKPSVLLKFVTSEHADVRVLVARLLPESFLNLMINDLDENVRLTVARRLPLKLVSEMLKKFPKDENLRYLQKQKRLDEAGLPNPKVDDEEFDLYGEEPMGLSAEGIDSFDLTDAWYEETAHALIKKYGNNIEGQWEEKAVKIYCDGMRSMGVEIDDMKLLDAVFELMLDHDDELLGENVLLSTATQLRINDVKVMPTVSENMDPVTSLVFTECSPSEYIKKFEEIFSVKYESSSNPAYSYLMEGKQTVMHPATAYQSGHSVRSVDERAVEKYVKAHNAKYKTQDEPYRLGWSPDPFVGGLVNFQLELK